MEGKRRAKFQFGEINLAPRGLDDAKQVPNLRIAGAIAGRQAHPMLGVRMASKIIERQAKVARQVHREARLDQLLIDGHRLFRPPRRLEGERVGEQGGFGVGERHLFRGLRANAPAWGGESPRNDTQFPPRRIPLSNASFDGGFLSFIFRNVIRFRHK